MNRLAELTERHAQGKLNDAEVLEFYSYQQDNHPNPRARGYAFVIAAMYIFVPYLEERPELIPAFIEALFKSSQKVFAGVNGSSAFWEFLESKAYVDDKLGAALKKHRPIFEAAIQRLFQTVTATADGMQ